MSNSASRTTSGRSIGRKWLVPGTVSIRTSRPRRAKPGPARQVECFSAFRIRAGAPACRALRPLHEPAGHIVGQHRLGPGLEGAPALVGGEGGLAAVEYRAAAQG